MNTLNIPHLDIPASQNPQFLIDYVGIKLLLPHRYPFLFVDGISSFEQKKTIAGLKHFTLNEPFFNGHFPTEPVVPGVIQIEALAQVSACLMRLSFSDIKNKRPAFTGIDGARFKQPVRPGDTLVLKAELQRMRRGFAVLNTVAELRGKTAAEADIMAVMV